MYPRKHNNKPNLLQRYSSKVQNIRSDKKGLALIEFAFGLPVVLLVGMAGLETVHFTLTHQQVSQIAMLVADNAARTQTQTDESNINEIFFGAQVTSDGLDIGTNGRIILSQLVHNEQSGTDEGNWIRWQRCYGELGRGENLRSSYGETNDGRFDNSLEDGMGPVGNQIAATRVNPINFVEIIYEYQPLINNPITTQFYEAGTRIRYTAAFVVRQRTNQRLTNVGALSFSQRFPCSSFRKFS